MSSKYKSRHLYIGFIKHIKSSYASKEVCVSMQIKHKEREKKPTKGLESIKASNAITSHCGKNAVPLSWETNPAIPTRLKVFSLYCLLWVICCRLPLCLHSVIVYWLGQIWNECWKDPCIYFDTKLNRCDDFRGKIMGFNSNFLIVNMDGWVFLNEA